MEALTVFVIVILTIVMFVMVLSLVGWIVTSYQMMMLLREVGYDQSALAWLPLSKNVCNMLGQCELHCASKVTESNILWAIGLIHGAMMYMGCGVGAFARMDNPAVTAVTIVVSLLGEVLGLILWAGGIMAIIRLCKRTNIGELAPILCYILVPYFGKAIAISLIRKGVRAGKVSM